MWTKSLQVEAEEMKMNNLTNNETWCLECRKVYESQMSVEKMKVN